MEISSDVPIFRNYIEFLKASKWNGSLPTTVAGSSGTFLNIK